MSDRRSRLRVVSLAVGGVLGVALVGAVSWRVRERCRPRFVACVDSGWKTIAFARGGDRLFTPDEGGVSIFSLPALVPLGKLEHPTYVDAIAVSPAGDLVATAAQDHVVRLFAADGSLVRALPTWRGPDGEEGDVPLALAFAADGRTIHVASELGFHAWSVLDGTAVATVSSASGDLPLAFATFSPRGERVAALAGDGIDRVLRVFTASGVLEGETKGRWSSVRFAPDGTLYACGVVGGKPALLAGDARSLGAWRTLLVSEGAGALEARAVSPDGSVVAVADLTGGETDRLIFVSTTDGRVRRSLQVPGFAAEAAFSPDGDRIAVRSGNGPLYLLPVSPLVELAVPSPSD